jgi:hypothetical protein
VSSNISISASMSRSLSVNSETIMVLSFNWAEVPQLLQTCSTSESHHHAARDLGHGSSSTQIFIQNHTY